MAETSLSTILVQGVDLCEDVLGKVSFADFTYFEIMGHFPDQSRSRLFDAMLITLVEHGLTPSAITARLTFLGAPEAVQGAVAAGLLGIGEGFVGTMEGAARLLHAHVNPGADLDEEASVELAVEIVQACLEQGSAVPGLGHPVHKDGDPRTAKLFKLASELGLASNYVQVAAALPDAFARVKGLRLPLNATGALGALVCEMGIPIRLGRGLGLVARAAGLLGHLREELNDPIARKIWDLVEAEAETARGRRVT